MFNFLVNQLEKVALKSFAYRFRYGILDAGPKVFTTRN